MIGQFFFPTLESIELSVKCFIRNTDRGDDVPVSLKEAGLFVHLNIYEQGRVVFQKPHFAEVPLNGLLEISESTCPEFSNGNADRVVLVECELPNGDRSYFPQEHQVVYTHRRSGKFTSLLYDQLPCVLPSKDPSPIIVLAPKVWVGKNVNTYVVFANVWHTSDVNSQEKPLIVTVLDLNGRVLHTQSHTERLNSVWLFNVREALAGKLALTEAPVFLNVVARGGSSTHAIVTFIVNDRTGNVALEHSLPPPYYLSGKLARVRNEALMLTELR